MKVNLLLDNDAGCLENYLNLDPFARQGTKTLVCDPTNMSEYVDEGGLSELRAFSIMSFFGARHLDDLITHWVSRLEHGGELIVSDVDIVQVMKAFSRGELDFLQLNSIIYGPQTTNWNTRKCALAMSEVCEGLISSGLDIIEKRFENVMFVIKAVRP